mmetsp:Transcript_15964/g.38151  ORF Transcript_15964/g.38151 Transcript_15964/m.38151 type:complete len:87 (+) Transcript_15964:626-886(+)
MSGRTRAQLTRSAPFSARAHGVRQLVLTQLVQIESLGATHKATDIQGVCVDSGNKLATAPAFMYEGPFHEIHDSVGKMVDETLKMA